MKFKKILLFILFLVFTLISIYVLKIFLNFPETMELIITLIYLFLIYNFYLFIKTKKDINKIFAFISYLILLIIVLFYREQLPEAKYNLIPFRNNELNINNLNFLLTIFNLLAFFPISIMFKKIKVQYMIIIFLIVEIIQYYFRVGRFDITDIILYLLGFLLGKLIIKIKEKYERNHRTNAN